MKRNVKKGLSTKKLKIPKNEQMEVVTDDDYVNDLNMESAETEVQKYIDKECQVNIEVEGSKMDNSTFVCNTYTLNYGISDVAIQTEVAEKLICECKKKIVQIVKFL